MKIGAPDGIDCYFDNVGGDFTSTVVTNHLRTGGRVAVCGTISGYNSAKPQTGVYPWGSLLMKQARVQGFMSMQFDPVTQWPNAFAQIAAWIKEGKLVVREHITEGFENMQKAFHELFSGANVGKAIVKV